MENKDMKVLYFDCFSGISGDMTLGTLIDLGVDEKILAERLRLLNVDGYELSTEKKLKNGIMGTEASVLLEEHHHEHDHGHGHDDGHHHHHEHRSYADIERLIDESGLNENEKALSKKIFLIVAEAEAKIHGSTVAEVHFHEVGAVDSIVDIVGTAICIDQLGVDRIVFSKIPLSRGFVKCQHGIFPVPAPATLEILRDVPVYFTEAGFELVTPTGAAIVKALGDEFGSIKEMQIDRIGYGLGKKTYEIPNVLRTMLFSVKKKSLSWGTR